MTILKKNSKTISSVSIEKYDGPAWLMEEALFIHHHLLRKENSDVKKEIPERKGPKIESF